ncbi:MAG: DUF1249 domain-containing protein [Pseudomonadota bacterium]
MAAKPTVGGLMALCEENYFAFMRLAPGVGAMSGVAVSRAGNTADLVLHILENSRYTSLVQLTHHFCHHSGEKDRDPDARLRIYHDARQVELVDLRQSILPVERRFEHPALILKWRANIFINKWLAFCLAQGHSFSEDTGPGESLQEQGVLEPA